MTHRERVHLQVLSAQSDTGSGVLTQTCSSPPSVRGRRAAKMNSNRMKCGLPLCPMFSSVVYIISTHAGAVV